MKYSVRAITFGINCGNTFGITFSAAKVLLFFDIHKFMSKKKLHIFSICFPSGNSCTINYGITTKKC